MKLKENMYVRTKWGIAKYIKELVTKQTIYRLIDKKIVYENVEDWEDCLLDNEITKASHNVINLIEKNDFVNGAKVIYTNDDYVFVLSDKGDLIKLGNDKEIKSIVTKEQFESMSYKV